MTAADLVADLLFGAIGFVAFVFGRKQGRWKTMALGIVLMAYPYFISDTILNYVIGIVLTICLFMFTD